MNAVMIIPTGIGCEIGGHAGDATPVAKLLAACCDKLILHPNVVNASDINEMPQNSFYVEGSMLDRFLEGQIELKEVRQNRVLVAVNSPIRTETINAVSAARATMGLDAQIVVLNTHLRLIGKFDKTGRATGDVFGWEELVEQVWQYEFDALAIATFIEVEKNIALNYYREGGVNPWGGVEAKVSKLICEKLNLPTAHAPIENEDPEMKTFNEVVDPRIAAEAISFCYLHCVLKGLHKAPQIGKGVSIDDIDCLVSPYRCWGRPHEACLEAKIPIIAVKENINCLNVDMGEVICVENYIEAAGLLMAMKAGIHKDSVRRPLIPTEIINTERTGG